MFYGVSVFVIFRMENEGKIRDSISANPIHHFNSILTNDYDNFVDKVPNEEVINIFSTSNSTIVTAAILYKLDATDRFNDKKDINLGISMSKG